MKFSKASPAERSALVRMVSASARLIVAIGRLIRDDGLKIEEDIHPASEEFVDAIIGVQESEEEVARESYR